MPQSPSGGRRPDRSSEIGAGPARLDAAKALTFKDAAVAYIGAHRAGWRNPKHIWQWGATLVAYANPIIGDLSLQAIDTTLILKVLEPIWPTKPETASRLRGRIEAVLDWAIVRGYRKGENPARWRGHLSKLLPARSKVRKVKHLTALPYAELPGFMVALRAQGGIAARALEFTILTAARTGEAIGAKWNEISLTDKVWTVPAERMKAGKERRVPLSGPALRILENMNPGGDGADHFVFQGGKHGKALSNMAMIAVLRRMGRGDTTMCTASGAHFAIGPPNGRISQVRSPKWHWRVDRRARPIRPRGGSYTRCLRCA